jgi:hypothetical protein
MLNQDLIDCEIFKEYSSITPAIEVAWDYNFNFFFDVLVPVLKNPDFIFNKIANYNQCENLFKLNLKKVKLNKELIDEIFDKFSFKFITKVSKPIKIIMEIYNTYFGKKIIFSKVDDNRHVEFNMSFLALPLYEFSKNNLLLDGNENKIVYNNLSIDNEELEIVI